MITIIIFLYQSITFEHLPCFLAGGDYNAVVVSNSFVYFATGRGFEMYNLNFPNPKWISRFATESPAFGIDIDRGYAYLACHNKGLCVVDISNPSEPKLVSYFDTEGHVKAVKIRNRYAYIADWENGFLILDIDNPANPQIIGHCSDIGQAYSVTLKDTFAFVGSFDRSLKIINIKNPQNPVILGEFPNGENVYGADAYIDDTIAYINCGFFQNNKHYHFAVVDIKNPAKPTFISGLTIPATNVGITKYKNNIIANAQDDGFFVIDIANPSQPEIINVLNQGHGWGRNIIVYDYKAIIPQLAEGFSILSINNPQDAVERYKNQNIKWQYLSSKGGSEYAYIIGNIMDGGFYVKSLLKILDIHNPEKPLVTCANLRLDGMGVIYEGSIDFPYLAITLHQGHPAHDSLSTLIVNVKRSCTPQIVKTIKGGGPTELRYPYLFVLDHNRIMSMDINKSMTWTDSLNINREIYDLLLTDSLIFVTGKDSLYIINIKTSQIISSRYHGKPYAKNMSYIYPILSIPYTPYPGSTYGFCFFDISNPTEPRNIFDTLIIELPVYPDCINTMGCVLNDSFFIVGRGDYGFDIWNVKKPQFPFRLASQDTPNNATHCYPPGNSNIFIKNSIVFLIDGGSLEIYNLINKPNVDNN